MPKTEVAKLFKNGSSQAVRLPREFRFEGDKVRIRHVARGVLLEPIISDTTLWFHAMDQFAGEFMARTSRSQPKTPRREIFK